MSQLFFFPSEHQAQEQLPKSGADQSAHDGDFGDLVRQQGSSLSERHGLMGDCNAMSTPRRPCKRCRCWSGAGRYDVQQLLAVGPYLNGLDLVITLAGWSDPDSYRLRRWSQGFARSKDGSRKVVASGVRRFGAAADWGLRLILRKLSIDGSRDVRIIQASSSG